ncbi:MAG: creatininase family protein [Planctomycetes bacterium]|nr:creatininase family protein [Planctomycetota bacterium]
MRYGDCRWVDIAAVDKKKVVVVCPLASLEQHGHHLPLLTDTYLVTGVAEEVHKRLKDKILLTPALWLGASDHHLDFPGTVTVPNTLYTQMIQNMARCFVKAGFRRIFFLNGHGGNVVPGVNALTELANSCDSCDDTLMVLSSYWTIARPVLSPDKHGMATPQLSHACEYETSMMLHLQKKLVVMKCAKASPPAIDSPFYHMEHGGRVDVAGRFYRKTETGAMGHPELATPEKGESLLRAIVAEVCAFIEDFSTWRDLPVLKPG